MSTLVCVSRAKPSVIGTCAFHTTCVCADRRRQRRQRPNVLKFSVSSLTWANPCSFAPVAVRARNAYCRRRRRLRSNSQQMLLKTAQPLAGVAVTAPNKIEAERRSGSFHATLA